jgi:hypothetical protein
MTTLKVPGKSWQVQIKLVTPELARTMLFNLHEDQRRLRIAHATALMAHMEAGRFEGVDTIKIDCNGEVIDGQHRLQAIAQSGEPQYLLIVSNVPDCIKQYLDQGARRSEGDRLKMQFGLNPSTGVKTALKLLRTDLCRANYDLSIYKEDITLMYEDLLLHEKCLKLLSQLDSKKKRGNKWLNGPQLAAAMVVLYRYDCSVERAGSLWRWAHLASHGTSIGGGINELEEHNGRKFFEAIRSKKNGLGGREVMQNYKVAVHVAEQHMLGKKAQFKAKEKHTWTFPGCPDVINCEEV